MTYYNLWSIKWNTKYEINDLYFFYLNLLLIPRYMECKVYPFILFLLNTPNQKLQ